MTQMGATFGRALRLTIFGESHGRGIGAVLDGLKSGWRIDEEFIKSEMARRAPGKNILSTQRKEADAFIIESGAFKGFATGTPLCVLIQNSDQHSKDYSILKTKMRPGHADYAGFVKYDGFNDYRGGGHFSGRITAPLVFAGALAKTVLEDKGITVGSHIASIGDIEDGRFDPLGETSERLHALTEKILPVLNESAAPLMEKTILQAREEKDSVGGVIECMATGLPAGIGDPFFDSLESRIAHMVFSIPAVKGLEFGKGFEIAKLNGSRANDPMYVKDGRVLTTSNNNGGITGGISNGMPIVLRVAVKPTASISRPQETVDVEKMENTVLEIEGRHDPCIVPRAVPVVEAAVAFALLDALMEDAKI